MRTICPSINKILRDATLVCRHMTCVHTCKSLCDPHGLKRLHRVLEGLIGPHRASSMPRDLKGLIGPDKASSRLFKGLLKDFEGL